MGTPDFAVPTLEALAREHDVVLVVAQPDKPAGRGMKLHPPAVVVKARELGLPLVQPAKVREALDVVASARPDLGIVVAYGKILPPSLLAIPARGFLNVHASILPRWRGAAPIQRAIEAGDRETGVTIMRVDEQLDHGPTLAIATTPIGDDEHTPSLASRLSQLGAETLLPALASAVETPQDHAQATYAAKIEKSEGEVRWGESARTIYDRFRAFDPWPGLFTDDWSAGVPPASPGRARDARAPVKLLDLRPAEGHAEPGTILRIDDQVLVATGDNAIEILAMQRPGKGRAGAGEVARALGWRAGARLA